MTDQQETAVRRWLDRNWRRYVVRDPEGRLTPASVERLADACLNALGIAEEAAIDELLRPEVIEAALKQIPYPPAASPPEAT